MKLILSIISSLSAVFLFSLHASAQQSPFQKEFIANYKANLFTQQAELVKNNKTIIPGEIKSLVADATSPDKTYEQKMALLNIASAMAYMHMFWNEDDKPLIELEIVLRSEAQKEKERVAEVERWKKYEKFLGNIVMKEHRKQMEEAGLTPVVFPHWLHRIWFQCKVCHQDMFVMKKRVNGISQARILEGKQCGVCHDGKLAFGADKNCERCHNAEKPGAEGLYDLTRFDHMKIKGVATRLGAEWNMENLAGGNIPVDRFGHINWLELKAKNVFKPINSLERGFKEEVRNSQIIFETATLGINNVLFDHGVHSAWIQCATCHPSIFIDKLGENRIKMIDMAAGEACGFCHGKVSFTFADCPRCHTLSKDKKVEGALIHKNQP